MSNLVIAHHVGIIIGFLRGAHQVQMGQVSREGFRAVYQHLL